MGRVPAPDLETAIEGFLRERFPSAPGQGLGTRELVEAHLQRAVVLNELVELTLTAGQDASPETATLSWQRKSLVAEKGPTALPPPAVNETKARDALLAAIGQARGWVREVIDGASFATIAQREGKTARYIRRLMPLAFVPPGMVKDLIEGTIRPPTIEALAPRVPLAWPARPKAF